MYLNHCADFINKFFIPVKKLDLCLFIVSRKPPLMFWVIIRKDTIHYFRAMVNQK